jgi:hypothetical protein
MDAASRLPLDTDLDEGTTDPRATSARRLVSTKRLTRAPAAAASCTSTGKCSAHTSPLFVVLALIVAFIAWKAGYLG